MKLPINQTEFWREVNEIYSSKQFKELSKINKDNYKKWLMDTAKHPERYQDVIHNIKYRLGILRTQLEKEEEK